MPEVEVTLTLDVPEGYEVVDYRVPKQGEVVLDRPDIAVEISLKEWSTSQLILRKLPSPTLLVELPRETVESLTRFSRFNSVVTQVVADACRAAIEAEAQGE